ncbi:hypothetical protein IU501_31265 [Nocardia otitidiscaviarum]|uniref:Xylulose 5-phosphate/Fructose 6-phosphate phosphoketolase C-terminal domain-containing protein n=1 Tax=Nocardia otitidiscaviarum TaxID=1823 RepID=A0A378X772_9NOCA|nr:hypothetical protein [Nocardia otitidiscaviarum]MBF6137456.1 hypothetical protein [Nocardia otitidiscaviarum]MBF6488282.1 hypothetical protein [Nocardia otitidiscaviarum]SUA49002.1 Uncharacterised protein [Nocardia otitidiscaviarum]
MELAAIEQVPRLTDRRDPLRDVLLGRLARIRAHIHRVGDDPPEITDWCWPRTTAPQPA